MTRREAESELSTHLPRLSSRAPYGRATGDYAAGTHIRALRNSEFTSHPEKWSFRRDTLLMSAISAILAGQPPTESEIFPPRMVQYRRTGRCSKISR